MVSFLTAVLWAARRAGSLPATPSLWPVAAAAAAAAMCLSAVSGLVQIEHVDVGKQNRYASRHVRPYTTVNRYGAEAR